MSVKPASSRIMAAAIGGLLAGLAPTLAGAAPTRSVPAPAITLAVGGNPLVSIGGSGASVPPVGVTVLPPTGTGASNALGVSVGGQEVSVGTPTVPPVEPPAPPKVEVPTPTVPVPAPPPGGVPSPVGSVATPVAGATATGSTAATPSAAGHAASVPAGRPGAAGIVPGTRVGGPARGAAARAKRRRGAAPAAGFAAAGLAAGAPGRRRAPTVTARRAAAVAQPHRSSSNPLESIGRALQLPLPVPDWSKPIILALLVLAVGFGLRSRLATRRARRLERRQGELLRDLETMQAALAPEVPARIDGLGLSIAYRPAEGPAAGGDFYDVFALEPGIVAVILGDVAGHGHDALKQAALTRYTLRAFLKEVRRPRLALKLAGHALSEPGCEQLATVAIALFDTRRGVLTYALAGHPPPILLGVKAAEAPASCSSPPLGPDLPTGRRERTVTLPAGARACFFSDGLIEARCAPGEGLGATALLGRERLRELLEQLPEADGAEELLAALRAETTATPDDMIACILTPGGPAADPAVDLEELELDRRALERGHLRSYLDATGIPGAEAERLQQALAAALEGHDTVMLEIDRSGPVPRARLSAPSGAGATGQQAASTGAPALLGA
jgi:serine phosphatase RsbU (regulator of sigma subunit)